MKVTLASLLAIVSAVLAPCLAAPPSVVTIAVFDFESSDQANKDLGAKVSSLISVALSAQPELITVERAELQKILGEQELGLSGSVSGDTSAKVGHLTGAKILVTGRVIKVDEHLTIVAKIIGAETSRVHGEMVKGEGTQLTDLAGQLAQKVAQAIVKKRDSLLPLPTNPAARLEKIRESLKGKTLPVVAVKIPEQHIGQVVRDPAAETELLLILQQAGFTIADERSKQKPDIEITGEAFSALGLRKGSLIACKARVEVKVQDLRTRELVLVDRETSVGVDLTEQTAAKLALQNAAAQLAERILPKLAK